MVIRSDLYLRAVLYTTRRLAPAVPDFSFRVWLFVFFWFSATMWNAKLRRQLSSKVEQNHLNSYSKASFQSSRWVVVLKVACHPPPPPTAFIGYKALSVTDVGDRDREIRFSGSGSGSADRSLVSF